VSTPDGGVLTINSYLSRSDGDLRSLQPDSSLPLAASPMHFSSIAITRAVPNTFADATMEVLAEPKIDVNLARAQHAGYVQALSNWGLTVIELDADDRHPDCCFVEDCAVVAGGLALITRSGAASRRGEAAEVHLALSELGPIDGIETMEAPATLDGGDCMVVGKRLFIGLSSRTNPAGVERAREVFEPHGFSVIAVPLSHALHLKCLVSPLGEDRILLADRTISPEIFGDLGILTVPHAEAYAANAVARENSVLVAAGFDETRSILERAGFSTVPIAGSEMRKADGSLTCLSILI